MTQPSSGNSLEPAAWAQTFIRLRWLNIAVLAGLTGVLGFLALGIKFNFSPDNLFISQDPALTFYQEKLIPNFGAGGNFSILCLEGDVQKKEVQNALLDAHELLEKQEGVQHVLSLKNAQMILESYDLQLGEIIYEPHEFQNAVLKQQIDGEEIEAGSDIAKGSVIDLEEGNGIWVYADETYPSSLDVEHCTIINSLYYGVSYGGISTGSIKNCNLINTNFGVKLFDESDVNIVNSIFAENNSMGVAMYTEEPTLHTSYSLFWENADDCMENCPG